MKVISCKTNGMEVSPATYNACTFQIIDKWNPNQHAKTCDTMFYLRDGTGAYVWDCDHWTFLDFTGFTSPDWLANENETGFIKNKPFKTLGNGLSVDENGVLSVTVKSNIKPDWNAKAGDDSEIINKPFKTLGKNFTVDNDGKLSVNAVTDVKDSKGNLLPKIEGVVTLPERGESAVTSVNAKTGDVVLSGTDLNVSPTDSRTIAEAIVEGAGDGSIIYGGSFGWANTTFTGADTFRKRATGSILNIEGNDSNFVTADPESGVALFTNPTSTPITVILNPAYSGGRSTGSADTLPKKINVTMVNADIDSGIGDNAHISHGAGSILAMPANGYTNNQSLMPTYFTVPANGTFRLSFEIDGYGALSDTYLISANATYVAFRQDAKVMTEAINIPWTDLNGANSGTYGQFKKIGSWTVIRWNIKTGEKAGDYALGTIFNVDARPQTRFFAQVPVSSTNGSETQHLQINQKDGSGAGGVTLLNATANTTYGGQVVFNNDSAETVAVPYLEPDHDIIMPDNDIILGEFINQGTPQEQGTVIKLLHDSGISVETRTPKNQIARRARLVGGALIIEDISTDDNSVLAETSYSIDRIAMKTDVPWQSISLKLANGWTLRGSDTGFEIRNRQLFVNINALQTQKALGQNATTLIATVPNVFLNGISRIETAIFPGKENRIQGFMEINSSGEIYFHNYDAVPAQTGNNYNQVRGYFNVPLV